MVIRSNMLFASAHELQSVPSVARFVWCFPAKQFIKKKKKHIQIIHNEEYKVIN